jgi:hypothetical protein
VYTKNQVVIALIDGKVNVTRCPNDIEVIVIDYDTKETTNENY